MENTVFNIGDHVTMESNAVYFTGRQISPLIKSLEWVISGVSGSRVMLGKSADGYYTLNAPVDAKYLSKVSE